MGICTTWPSFPRDVVTSRDQVSTHKLVVSRNFLSIRIVLSCFYLLIFYFEKFATWIWRLPFALYVKLKLSILIRKTSRANGNWRQIQVENFQNRKGAAKEEFKEIIVDKTNVKLRYRVYSRASPCGISAIWKKMPHKSYVAASNGAQKKK